MPLPVFGLLIVVRPLPVLLYEIFFFSFDDMVEWFLEMIIESFFITSLLFFPLDSYFSLTEILCSKVSRRAESAIVFFF